MATEPPLLVTFRTPSRGPYRSPGKPFDPDVGRDRSPPARPEATVQPVYQLALDLSKRVFTIIELTEAVERFHLRDALDKKSTAISMIVARALGTADMVERRALYRKAHEFTTECRAILDVLAQRGTVEPAPLDQARVTAADLCSKLVRLCDRWRELPAP